MAKTWILCDVDQDRYVADLHLGPADAGDDPRRGYSIRKRTLRGGLRDGVDVVELRTGGGLELTIVPTRGMSLHRMSFGDTLFGWRSPVRGPVHPKFVELEAPHGIGWLQGFDELLVRCGLESNGAPQFNAQGRLEYPLHGRIGNLPAQYAEITVDPAAGTIAVSGVVDEARLFGPRLQLKSTYVVDVVGSSCRVIDEVSNLSGKPQGIELLYHINLGQPLLSAGARLVAPVKTLVPRNEHAARLVSSWSEFPEPFAGVDEAVYLLQLAGDAEGRSGVVLESANRERGFAVGFDLGQLPHFAFWKAPHAYEDGYVTGLEPTLNWPNPRSFEESQGRVLTLKPGETRRFELELSPLATGAEVRAASERVRAWAQGVTPKIHDRPQPGWVPT